MNWKAVKDVALFWLFVIVILSLFFGVSFLAKKVSFSATLVVVYFYIFCHVSYIVYKDCKEIDNA